MASDSIIIDLHQGGSRVRFPVVLSCSVLEARTVRTSDDDFRVITAVETGMNYEEPRARAHAM